MYFKVDVEARHYRLLRVGPLRDEHVLRVVLVEPAAHLPPQLHRGLLVLVAFHQRGSHVDTETVNALVHPEGHDVAQLAAHRLRSRRVDALLPRAAGRRVGIAVVERRLALIVVLVVVLATWRVGLYPVPYGAGLGVLGLAAAGNVGHIFFPYRVAPYVIVAVTPVGALLRLYKPLALVARVASHEVEAHLHAPLVSLVDQPHQVVVVAKARIHLVEVDDIIAAVEPPRLIHRVEPQRVHAQLLQVVEPRGDAWQVAHPVAVAVHVARGVDLIKHSLAQPLGPLAARLRHGRQQCSHRQRPKEMPYVHSRRKFSHKVNQNPHNCQPTPRAKIAHFHVTTLSQKATAEQEFVC